MGCFKSKSAHPTEQSPITPEPTLSSRQVSRVRTTSVASAKGRAGSVASVSDLKVNSGTFIQYLTQPLTIRYRVIKELGSGQFGKVYLAEHRKSGDKRAVKEIEKAKATKVGGSHSKFISEVEIISKLDHPNIIKLYEMYEDPKKYYVVSELCTGGEMFDYISSNGQLSESLAADVMKQLLSAVSYCHSNRIVHRDLKPENLLLDSPPREGQPLVIKVIDFGTSTLISPNQQLRQKLGTAYYIAPEVLQQNYNEKCDVWSCGVILYILLSGVPPFMGQTDEEILKKIRIGRFSFSEECWTAVSDDAKSMIRKMLVMDPSERISASQCLDEPWIQRFATQQSVRSQSVLLSLNCLQSFTREQKLRQAFLTFISSQMLTKEVERQLSASFRAIDTNGDGRLSRDELLEAYRQTMADDEAEEAVNKVMRNVDADHSGFIDYSEFIIAAVNYTKLLSKTTLEEAFSAFDKDGSGKISAEELKTMLGKNSEVRDEVWKALISEADQDGDGEIEFKEFTRLMLNAVVRQAQSAT